MTQEINMCDGCASSLVCKYVSPNMGGCIFYVKLTKRLKAKRAKLGIGGE